MTGEGVAVLVVFFSILGTVGIIWVTTRHRERMAMVQKGLTSEEIKAMYACDTKGSPLASLKWGILLVLAGVAIMLGNFLHDYYGVDHGVIVGMVCLFVGIGLVAFYSIAAKKVNSN